MKDRYRRIHERRQREVGRRRFTRLAIGSAAIAASVLLIDRLTQNEEPFSYFPSKPEQYYTINNGIEVIPPISSAEGEIDPDYAAKTKDHFFADNEATPEERGQAVLNNLARFVTLINGAPFVTGNALMIDKSGYFLTVAHDIDEDIGIGDRITPISNLVGMILPMQNKLVQTKSAIAAPHLDFALVYAPTGEKQEPVENINFVDNPRIDGSQALMYALARNAILAIHRGTVEYRDNLEHRELKAEGAIKIMGLIPFGGASGAPVINTDGKITGVLKSAINPSGVNNIENYIGSYATSVDVFPELASRGIVYNLRT